MTTQKHKDDNNKHKPPAVKHLKVIERLVICYSLLFYPQMSYQFLFFWLTDFIKANIRLGL